MRFRAKLKKTLKSLVQIFYEIKYLKYIFSKIPISNRKICLRWLGDSKRWKEDRLANY